VNNVGTRNAGEVSETAQQEAPTAASSKTKQQQLQRQTQHTVLMPRLDSCLLGPQWTAKNSSYSIVVVSYGGLYHDGHKT